MILGKLVFSQSLQQSHLSKVIVAHFFACWEMKEATRWHHNLDILFIPFFVGEGKAQPQTAARGFPEHFLAVLTSDALE